MSKIGRGRRSAEQRAERKAKRQEAGRGIFRYLTPKQASTPEFKVSETPKPEVAE